MKTNKGLTDFAASKLGTPYVYGMKGAVMTRSKYDWLKKTYGRDMVWDSDVKKVGKVCVDCSGLISWYTGKIKSSSMFKAEAKAMHPISTIEEAPIGAAVWRKGHIGIYVGKGYAIEARGSAYGVVKTKIAKRDWTHWFLLNDITYEAAKEYFKKYTGASGSIVDALASIGAEKSFSYRQTIAKANGITGYVGTASQNTTMLAKLKKGTLIKP